MSQTSSETQSGWTLGNPAVVGLAGFGMTTLELQFHNLGWISITPVIWFGFLFGGLAQLIAGLQEQKTGNNFGYCAFTGYGIFWISLCAYLLGSTTGIKMLALNETDVGFFMFAWTIFTFVLWIGTFKISKALWIVFFTLLLGFIGLDLVFWGFKGLLPIAAWDLIVCALAALYVCFHVVLKSVFGRDVLPVGAPFA